MTKPKTYGKKRIFSLPAEERFRYLEEPEGPMPRYHIADDIAYLSKRGDLPPNQHHPQWCIVDGWIKRGLFAYRCEVHVMIDGKEKRLLFTKRDDAENFAAALNLGQQSRLKTKELV